MVSNMVSNMAHLSGIRDRRQDLAKKGMSRHAALSDTEVQYLGKRLIRNWRGVMPKDELPQTPVTGSFVINMQSEHEGDEKGTHWVSFVLTDANDSDDSGHERTLHYFDSFGVEPPEEVLAYAKMADATIIRNKDDFQAIDNEWCGWYDLYWLEWMQRERNQFEAVLRNFRMKTDQYAQNEEILKEWAAPKLRWLEKALRKPGSLDD